MVCAYHTKHYTTDTFHHTWNMQEVPLFRPAEVPTKLQSLRSLMPEVPEEVVENTWVVHWMKMVGLNFDL